jgi:ribosomal-protein-alanine N-acetyltransferase
VTVCTERLRLVPHSWADVEAMLDAMSPEDRAEISPEWLARARLSRDADPWTLGFAIRRADREDIIGRCGFKGPPDADGMVEIAYGVDVAHEHHGYASEAAAALVAYALADDRVQVVRAHTRSDSGASARILTKCGFASGGQVVDPEDGVVWRWERSRGR